MPVGVGWVARVCHDGVVSKTERPPLRLAQSDSADMDAPWVGGVASGVASRYGFPVGAVRATFGVLSAVAGAGIIASFLTALLGAVILLFVVKAVTKRA